MAIILGFYLWGSRSIKNFYVGRVIIQEFFMSRGHYIRFFVWGSHYIMNPYVRWPLYWNLDSIYIRFLCMGRLLYMGSIYGKAILQRISMWEGNYIRTLYVKRPLHKDLLYGKAII